MLVVALCYTQLQWLEGQSAVLWRGQVLRYSLHHVGIDIITQGYSHVRILMWFVRSLNRGD